DPGSVWWSKIEPPASSEKPTPKTRFPGIARVPLHHGPGRTAGSPLGPGRAEEGRAGCFALVRLRIATETFAQIRRRQIAANEPRAREVREPETAPREVEADQEEALELKRGQVRAALTQDAPAVGYP